MPFPKSSDHRSDAVIRTRQFRIEMAGIVCILSRKTFVGGYGAYVHHDAGNGGLPYALRGDFSSVFGERWRTWLPQAVETLHGQRSDLCVHCADLSPKSSVGPIYVGKRGEHSFGEGIGFQGVL